MRILIAEDDADINNLLAKILRTEHFKPIQAFSGTEAKLLFMHNTPDLILLDLMLPGTDGFEICKKIRETKNTPIIMISAKKDDIDKIRGLGLGADDYITKPFSPIVLAARVRTLLKREGRVGAPLEQLGKLSVNELRREVMVENKPIDLTPKEYELLIYFKNNRAIALSRESILNAVWGYDYFGDLRTVDTHVKKLRAKLGECGTMIETVRGYGYRFEV